MTKRIRILALVLGPLLLVAVIAGFWVLDDRTYPEPVYQGKRLSQWLDEYQIERNGADPAAWARADAEDAKVDEIVRKIGTNAIPALFRMLTAKDSPIGKVKFWIYHNGYYTFKERPVPAWARSIEASMGFRALGTDAKDAVPKLIELYERESFPYQETIAYALGGIGPPASNAVPMLLKNVTNGEAPYVADNSFRALGQIHAQPEIVVPLMIKFLKDPEPNVRSRAIWNLRSFGADAKSAAPALIESLNDSEEYVRTNAAKVLKVIDPEAAAKAGVK
jgi:HEAT repeat protein